VLQATLRRSFYAPGKHSLSNFRERPTAEVRARAHLACSQAANEHLTARQAPTRSPAPGPTWPRNEARGMRCIRNAEEEDVGAACALSKIPQFYAASPHCVVEGVGSCSPIGLEGRLCSDLIRCHLYGLTRIVLPRRYVNSVTKLLWRRASAAATIGPLYGTPTQAMDPARLLS
jgi:hypothetical protein